MRKLLLILLTSILSIQAFPQRDTTNRLAAPVDTMVTAEMVKMMSESSQAGGGNSVISASPNAYSFAKYVNVPTSSYTGVVPISIPLGSISEKGAQIDLSLSYHASGVKVDEIASWVGLGWSLNGGGVITRTVRSKAERPDDNGEIVPPRLDLGFPEPNENGFFPDMNIFEAAFTTNLNDIEPDIFYYNFNGRNGRFVFDDNGDVQFYKYEDIKVEFVKSIANDPVSAVNSKFIITLKNVK